MEIGPIRGVGPVTVATPAERPTDLTRVTAVELRHQGRDAEDSENEKASRGLEEDEAEESAARTDEPVEAGGSKGTISFFA